LIFISAKESWTTWEVS